MDSVGEIDEEDEDNMETVLVEESQQVLEAELRRQAEVEDEERKLAETLELQRRVEEEAKEKHLAVLKKKEAQRQAQGISQNQGSTVSIHCNSLSELNSGTYCGDYFPAPFNEGDADSQPSERSLILDSSMMNNAMNEGICRSTLSKTNEICESFASLQLTNNLCSEQPLDGFAEKDASDHTCIEIQSFDNLTKPTNSHAGPQDFETLDSSSSKPKRGGKNRKRKVARSPQEENSSRIASEENNTGGGQHLDQSKRSFINNEKVVCNGADNGLKSHDAGCIYLI